MLAKVNSSAIIGLNAVPVEVEVDIASQGLPSFTIVGLPDKAVEEAIEVKKETGKDEEEKGGFGGKMRKHEFSQVEEVGFR